MIVLNWVYFVVSSMNLANLSPLHSYDASVFTLHVWLSLLVSKAKQLQFLFKQTERVVAKALDFGFLVAVSSV